MKIFSKYLFKKIQLIILFIMPGIFSYAQGIQNNGNLYISGNVGILGTYSFTNAATASYKNDGNLYLYGDFTNNQSGMAAGSGTGNSDGVTWFQGSNTQSLSGTQPFNFYQMQLNKSAAANLVNMSQSVTVVNNLTLTKGIVTTGTNLFTWGNTGTLTAPQPTYLNNSTNYTNSFIATCDASGNPVNTGFGSTVPFTGDVGFKIKNVTSTNTYFPVGASFSAAGTGLTAAPNRMMINNQYGTPEDFTVVVNYGDIGYTPGGTPPAANRVNRVWYVKTSAASDAGKATMQLFYTKRNWTTWASGENEVESGFDYMQGTFIEKDYTGIPGNFIRLSNFSTDIPNFSSNSTYPYNTEIYGQYTIGKSHALDGSVIGINNFYRFSIVNSTGIILAVNVTNLKAYIQGNNIEINWTSANEQNIDHYEVEKSINGTDFNVLGKVTALNNGSPLVNYHFTDTHPANGNNFYRIKIIDKNEVESYTSITVVNTGNTKTGIYIFPNPVTAYKFTLQINNLAAGNYQLQVYDNLGRAIISKTISHPGGSASQIIYMPSGIAGGAYQLILLGSNRKLKSIFLIE